MFDTHVNLHGEIYDEDRSDVLARARAAGITKFLAICDRLDNLPTIRAICADQPDMWCSAGVHPHHSKDFPDLTADTLIAAASDPKIVAIGETGLDFHYGYSPEDAQRRCLGVHIEAARETGLPLILHTREADQMMADTLEAEMVKGRFQPLLHCYTGGADLAGRALALGAYFSVSGILSFRSAKEVRAVMADVPLDRVILETDCPYLTPVPHRGRRNEPAYLIHVCEALAALHERPVEEVAAITLANANRLFAKAA